MSFSVDRNALNIVKDDLIARVDELTRLVDFTVSSYFDCLKVSIYLTHNVSSLI